MQSKTERAAYRRRYLATHREFVAARGRAYRESHRHEITERNVEYRDTHRDEIRERDRQYREDNRAEISRRRHAMRQSQKDKLARQRRARYLANGDRFRAQNRMWARAHRAELRVAQHRYYAKRAGNGGSYVLAEWRARCNEWENRCLRCGAASDLTCDHVVPVSRGGRSDIDNLQLLCRSCNASKRDKIIDYRPTTKDVT
jgi:5-methylcytosine-specific restriction endonuclease McrA